ncbi:MAG: hypothetical protein GOVbin1096_89 [Prokaryotic dsDNA virus sp.]|jgi:hypothetical protein|nr:MAG: hypothetical protein GOVbin1096_89 [Prokaryotic dsDNA virus sp.]|tara:strand:+ start:16939 stop:17244 length:306 start_codon:yes stop_codon:yes gene_type:complete
MLKQSIRETLETVVQSNLYHHSKDETLAYDVSKQCVTDEDVDKCLEIMLEHISEQELIFFLKLIDTDIYKRYQDALADSLRVVDKRIFETLKLLVEQEGEA